MVTVTVAGSGAQSAPYSASQPPAAWKSLQVPVTGANAGDWLVAFVTWRQNTAGAGVAVSVGDDTMRNFWQPLGIPAGSSSQAGVMRCAIWVAPAAYAPQFVTVAPSGITPGTTAVALGCVVCDVAGMLPWQTLVCLSAAYVNAGTALTALTAAAPPSQALFLTCCGADNTPITNSLAGAGWTGAAFVSSTNGIDHSADLDMNTYYQVTTGSVSATWTASGPEDMAAVLTGVLVSGTPPVQASPDWPVTVAELAPGANAHNDPAALTWVPVTGRSLGLQGVTQGAQYNLAALTSAAGAIVLDNPDGQLIPGQAPAWQELWAGNGSVAVPSLLAQNLPVTAGLPYSWSALVLEPAGLGIRAGGVLVRQLAERRPRRHQLDVRERAAPVPAGTGSTGTLITLANQQAPAGAVWAQAYLTMSGTPPSTVQMYATAGPQPAGWLTAQPGITWTGVNGATATTSAAGPVVARHRLRHPVPRPPGLARRIVAGHLARQRQSTRQPQMRTRSASSPG